MATVEREGFRFIPGPFQYSAGVAALPGYAMRRIRFARPVAFDTGFQRIEAYLRNAGLPLTAFCACELRSPAPFTDQGFIDFNRLYVGTLQGWSVMSADTNPVARSNVCPELGKPPTPSFHAFSIAVPAPNAPPSFVIAGSGEALEAPGPYNERTIRHGETTPDAMAEKIRFVMGQMERRMAAIGADWSMVTATQIYTIYDIFPTLAQDIVAKGAAAHGVDWHYCRPPVVGLDFEMDTRSVFDEQVLPA